jgi:hypothetical protein
MQTGNWLEMGPLNRITYRMKKSDGQVVDGVLRFSLHQADAYAELAKKSDAEAGSLADQRVDLCHLALNPDPENEEWTREEIRKSLDLDEMGLIVRVWQQKKVSSPALSPTTDPNFF